MEFLSEYSLFLLKCFTVVVALLVLLAGTFAVGKKQKPRLEITSLNDQYDELSSTMNKEILVKNKRKRKNQKKRNPHFL